MLIDLLIELAVCAIFPAAQMAGLVVLGLLLRVKHEKL